MNSFVQKRITKRTRLTVILMIQVMDIHMDGRGSAYVQAASDPEHVVKEIVRPEIELIKLFLRDRCLSRNKISLELK